jgi:hypothetical protein
MLAIGYSSETAWVFPAIIDTAVAVGTTMLVVLGDKPACRTRAATASANTQTPAVQRLSQHPTRIAKSHVKSVAPTNTRAQTARHLQAQTSAAVQPDPAQIVQSAQTEIKQDDANLVSDLIASGVTTQSVDTVIAVLSSHRDGASINAAAKASGINYRTAQRIVEAAERRQRRLLAAS